MAFLQEQGIYLPLLFYFLLGLRVTSAYSTFVPEDHYLINCGSSSPVTIDNRVFVPDTDTNSVFLSASSSLPVRDGNPNPSLSALYITSRVFTRPSSYEFRLKGKGQIFLRFHFYAFSSQGYNLSSAVFSVAVNSILLMKEITPPIDAPLVKEYIINVNADKINVWFIPSNQLSSFAFVSAIEVFTAPKDLILDVAHRLDSGEIGIYNLLSKEAFETIYRLNVGGSRVTPFNDTLWRSWFYDEKYLASPSPSTVFAFSGRINYQDGGASREVAPDSVYRTARVMNSADPAFPSSNITWALPVALGYQYLVRLHFCDIVSLAVNELYFNIYVNGYLAFKDFDLSAVDISSQRLAFPYYVDIVLKPLHYGYIYISIGPSSLSLPSKINAILNGLEVMKMNNSDGSFDGNLTVGEVLELWPKGTTSFVGVLLFSILVVGTLMILARKRAELREAVAWLPLPSDAKHERARHISSPSSDRLVY